MKEERNNNRGEKEWVEKATEKENMNSHDCHSISCGVI